MKQAIPGISDFVATKRLTMEKLEMTMEEMRSKERSE